MLHSASVKMAQHIYTNAPGLDPEKRDHVRYAIEVILSESTKLVLLLMLFGIVHRLEPFLISLAFFMSFRFFSGGFHFESYWGCFFGSVALFSGIIGIQSILMSVSFSPEYIKGFLIGSGLLVTVLSPVPSQKRPIPRSEYPARRRRVFGILSALIAGTWIYAPLSTQALLVATLLLYALQLLIGGIIYENKTNYF